METVGGAWPEPEIAVQALAPMRWTSPNVLVPGQRHVPQRRFLVSSGAFARAARVGLNMKDPRGKKVCIGVVSHRRLQVETPEEVASAIRKALEHIPPEKLIVSTDCGFGRQGCNRDIAFFKTTAIAQGTNLVRAELGLPVSHVPAAGPRLQTDIVPKTADG